MSDSLGWIGVPIVPTFAGVGAKLSAGLTKPAAKAGKEATKEIERSTTELVKNLDKQVSASAANVQKTERAVQDAMAKRESASHKVKAATLEQELAEKKYQDALKSGGNGLAEKAKVEKAIAKVADETLKSVKAARDAEDAQRKHDAQLKDLEDTTEKQRKAQERLNSEVGNSGGIFDKFREDVRKAGAELDDTAGRTSGFGDKLMSGFGKIGTGALLGVGAKIGTSVMGGINTAFSSGFNRLASIEQAETMLGGLGHSAKSVDEIMDNAMDSVSGTAYGFGEAASMAATFAGAGIEQGEELTKVLSLVGDSAAITGADFEEMGSIWTKMASSGRLSTDEMNQMMDRGLGLLPELQKYYNVTADEARKMVSDGKVSFEDFSEIMENMVGGSAQAMGDTFSGSAANMQAALGRLGAKFLDPIYESAPAIFQAIGGAVDRLGEHLGPVIEDFSERLSPYVEDFAERLGPWLEETIDDLAERIGELVGYGRETLDWMRENKDIIGPLAVGVGSMATAFGLWTASVKAYTTATQIAATVTKIFDAITKKTVFGVIALAVIGLVTALVWFFTETETGQKIWESFTTAIGEGWDWLVDKFRKGWEWLKSNVFDLVMEFFTVTLGEAIDSALTWVGDSWDGLTDRFHDGWEWLRDSVLQPVADFFTVTLWGAIQSATTWIGNSWSALVDLFVGGWNRLKEAVFTAFQNVISALANWVRDRLGDIQNAWDYLGNFLHGVWNFINQYVIEAFMSGLGRLKDFFLGRVEDIKGIWQGLSDRLHSIWTWINENVFNAIGRGLDTVRGWFDSGVEAIKKIWDGLREAAAAPVRFVVNTVWNNGLLKAIEAVTKFIPGLEAPGRVDIGFARGGILPGFSRMRDGDDQLVPMRRGEGVLVSEGLQDDTSRRLFLAANEEAKRGKSFSEFLSDFANGYAGGGIIGSLSSVMGHFYPELQLTSGLRPGDSGYHGKGMAADFSNTGSGMPSTPAMQAAAAFMYGNYGDQLEQLIHHPARNIGSGMDVGDGFGYYGAGTMYGHTDHIHLAALRPLVDPSGVVQMVPYDGEGGGGFFNPINAAKAAWDAIVNKIGKFSGADNGSWFSQVPGAFLSHVGGKIWEFVSGKIGAGSYDGAGGQPGVRESWREMAVAAMRRNGFNADDPSQVEAMLSQIMSESGGIPDRNQEIVDVNGTGASAGQGLLQIIPGTFAAHRDPSLPDDRTDPWANMNAALRYYKSRYGTDLTTMWGHGHGYALGGIVDLLGAKVFDTGGILRDGQAAVNLSGADEIIINNEQLTALSKLGNNVGLLVRQLAATGDVDRFVEGLSAEFVPYLDKTNDWLEQVADPTTVEGVTARQIARRTMGLGIDIPGSEVLTALLDGEIAIGDARAQHVGHLKSIADAQEAYDEALKAHQETLEAKVEGMSEADSKRLADAQEAVSNAKDDEARKKAEEDLAKIRTEVDESTAKSAEERAEAVKKANADLKSAEEDLASARAAQVASLDHIIVLSQGQIEGLLPVAGQLADRLLGLGAPAGAVAQGLGAVTGALAAVSAFAGPAGLSLGAALSILQVAISVVSVLKEAIEEFFQAIADARRAAREGLVDFYDELVNMAEIVAEYQHINSTYTQELARLNNEITISSFELAKSIRDGFREVGKAERDMFSERARLNELFENAQIASQLKARGLMEDISTAFQFNLDAANQATVEMTDEMWEAYWSYEASRARFEQAKLQRDLGMLNAEFALEQARRDSLRWQEDINAQLQRSAALLAQANGIDLGEATLGKMTSDTLLELFEVQEQRKDAEGLFGLGNLFRKEEIAGLRNQEAYLREQLSQMAQEGGMTLTDADVDRILKELAKTSFLGGDPAMALKGLMPELASQLNAADSYQRWEPYYTVLDQQRERDRSLEDLEFDLEQFNKTFPLEQQIAGWESIASGFDALSMSYGQNLSDEERASLRKEFAQEIGWSVAHTGIKPALDEAFANIRDQVPDTVQVVVEGGRLYSEEDVLAIVDGALETVGVKTRAELVTSTELARSRRTPRV